VAYLVDTGVAVRCVLPADSQYQAVRAAILRLIARGETVVVSAQVLSEDWSLCTRPATSRGGYGLSISESDQAMNDLLAVATLLPEPPNLWFEHHRLLVRCSVSGVNTHDCRLAAWCLLSGIDHIITLNPNDFTRFGVDAVEPKDV
jgi:predicted nucleic acid-binding protein